MFIPSNEQVGLRNGETEKGPPPTLTYVSCLWLCVKVKLFAHLVEKRTLSNQTVLDGRPSWLPRRGRQTVFHCEAQESWITVLGTLIQAKLWKIDSLGHVLFFLCFSSLFFHQTYAGGRKKNKMPKEKKHWLSVPDYLTDKGHTELVLSAVILLFISLPNNDRVKPVATKVWLSLYSYLPTFGELKSGHLRYDVIWTMIAKRSLWGRSPRFSRGSGGMFPRKILKIDTVKYAFFNVWSMILHIYCKKSRPKIYPIFLRSEENDRRKNFLTKKMAKYAAFCLDNCLPRTGTWEKAKRHRRNLNSDRRTKRTGKKQF